MSLNPTPRFERAPAMLVAGIRQTHLHAQLAEKIPLQWQKFREQCAGIPNSRGVTYGVVCGNGPEGLEYLCGLEVESFDVIPAGLGRMRVPAQTYAVFTHDGPAALLGESWTTILHVLMPQLQLEDAHTPTFERYDERYNVEIAGGVCEIWIPVLETSIK